MNIRNRCKDTHLFLTLHFFILVVARLLNDAASRNLLILIYRIRNDDEFQTMCESLPSIRNGKEIILDPPLERNKSKNSSAALLKFQPWIEPQLFLIPPRS